MIYGSIILGACILTLFLLRLFMGFKPRLAFESNAKRETGWVSAILWAFVMAFVFGDPIVVHNIKLAPWGEALIFLTVFFLQIYLDKRTKMRGILLIGSILFLGIFYYVYSTKPNQI